MQNYHRNNRMLNFVIIVFFLIDALLQTIPCNISEMSGSRIANIGSETNFLITADNTLVGWGWNSDGALAGGLRDIYYPFIARRKILEDIVSLSQGGYRCWMAVDTSHTLWVWGDSADKFGAKKSDGPVKLMDGVLDVCLTNTYVIVLKTDGSLWTWGKTFDFQCPQKIMDHASSINIYQGISMAISEKKLYILGRNPKEMISNYPVCIADDIIDIGTTNTVCIALNSQGNIYHFDPVEKKFFDIPIATEVSKICYGGFLSENQFVPWNTNQLKWPVSYEDTIFLENSILIKVDGKIYFKIFLGKQEFIFLRTMYSASPKWRGLIAGLIAIWLVLKIFALRQVKVQKDA